MFLASSQAISAVQPFFRNSIVANDIDFMHASDPTVESTVKYLSTSRREMPDKRNDFLFDDSAHVFVMQFADGADVEIYVHGDFENFRAVERYTYLLEGPIGKLPLEMKNTLSHVVIHKEMRWCFQNL